MDAAVLPLCNAASPDSTTRYHVTGSLGCGAFSEVLRAEDSISGRVVALKRVFSPPPSRDGRGGPQRRPEREAQCLDLCRDPTVVGLLGSLADGTTHTIVLELMAADLGNILELQSQPRQLQLPASQLQLQLQPAPPQPLPPPVVRYVMRQLLRALAHVHALGVLHRDVKPANVLIAHDGTVKLGDFGLARRVGDGDRHREGKMPNDELLVDAEPLDLTHQVQSRWYRAPEILYASRAYSAKVDVWSAGCVLAELLAGAPLFKGVTDIDQLCRVVAVRGTPSLGDWPGAALLPDWDKLTFVPSLGVPLEQLAPLAHAPPDALGLLDRLLQWNPQHRPTAAEALAHPFFLHPPGGSEGEHAEPPPEAEADAAARTQLREMAELVDARHESLALASGGWNESGGGHWIDALRGEGEEGGVGEGEKEEEELGTGEEVMGGAGSTRHCSLLCAPRLTHQLLGCARRPRPRSRTCRPLLRPPPLPRRKLVVVHVVLEAGV